jgi:signal transduction histidine kinase
MIFKTARIKLTLWYLLIIAAVSLFFSILVYGGVNNFTKRALEMQKTRMERRRDIAPGMQRNTPTPIFEQETLLDIRKNLIKFLVRLNFSVIVISGILGYLLAGKTLKPIEDVLEEQKRFISDAAHELKTPITALKTEIEVSLKNKMMGKKEAVSVIKSNLQEVNRLQKLSESLLKESKYKTDSYDLKKDKIDLKELVEKVSEKMKRFADRKNIMIITNLTKMNVLGDQNSLKEAFTIILDNAIKYSHKDKKIKIKLVQEGSSAILEISDKGIGINKNELPLIFNRFYRADSSRSKSSADGFGLGLSIAQSIIELHEGTISVKSEPGVGSTFKITLPIA